MDVRILNEVVSINREDKKVVVKDIRTNEMYEESYDKLVLSMGAKPFKPPIKGIDLPNCFTLRTVPDTFRIKEYIQNNNPKSAVVVGGGYIGIEMAENLKEAGLDVILIELSDHLLPPLDFDMACDVHKYVRQNGINLMLNNGVREIEEIEDGLLVKLDKCKIQTDMVILCVGVRPESDIAKEANLQINERGSIIVNDNMLTSDPDIYAVGDAVVVTNFITKKDAFIPLASPANKQGRIAANNICGHNSRYEGTLGSSIVKLFDMTIATTGANESEAKASSLNYDKVFLYSNSHASYYPGATPMSIKVLFDKDTGKILGAQIVGFDGVDKRCDVLATAIRFGATYKDLTNLELCYAPFWFSKRPCQLCRLCNRKHTERSCEELPLA